MLGRWNIEYCSKKLNDKIDLSNEDHCGPCGNYAMKNEAEALMKSRCHIPKDMDKLTKTT